MLVFTSHALKPLHLNVCPSSTARNTAKSSSSSDKSPSTLIRLKTHSAMHLHNFLHYFFIIQQHHTGGALHPTGPPITTKFKQSTDCLLVLSWMNAVLACSVIPYVYLLFLSCTYVMSLRSTHKHRHSCYCPPLFMALPLQKQKTGRFLCTQPSSALGSQIFTVLACEVISGRV